MRLNIQTIDLAKWKMGKIEDLESISSIWHSAFRTYGLVYLKNHGLSDLYHDVCQEWLKFCSCDQEHKDKFSSPAYGGCGYNKVGREAVSLSEEEADAEARPDPVESLENGYSPECEGAFPRTETGYCHGDRLSDVFRELYSSLDTKVIRPCLDIASSALQLPPGSDMVTSWYCRGPGAYQLRLAHYVPPQRPGGLLYGEHTDYDGLTFLWRNSDNGLQARVEDIWCDIPLLEEDRDALLINLGDLMEFWTRGTWVSPLHRVANIRPSGDPEALHLVSIVMFAGQLQRMRMYFF